MLGVESTRSSSPEAICNIKYMIAVLNFLTQISSIGFVLNLLNKVIEIVEELTKQSQNSIWEKGQNQRLEMSKL